MNSDWNGLQHSGWMIALRSGQEELKRAKVIWLGEISHKYDDNAELEQRERFDKHISTRFLRYHWKGLLEAQAVPASTVTGLGPGPRGRAPSPCPDNGHSSHVARQTWTVGALAWQVGASCDPSRPAGVACRTAGPIWAPCHVVGIPALAPGPASAGAGPPGRVKGRPSAGPPGPAAAAPLSPPQRP